MIVAPGTELHPVFGRPFSPYERDFMEEVRSGPYPAVIACAICGQLYGYAGDIADMKGLGGWPPDPHGVWHCVVCQEANEANGAE